MINYETTIVKGMSAGNIPLIARISKAFMGALVQQTRGTPIPIEDRADGVDTSFWEGTMNFGKNPLLKFACIKATQGTTKFDSQYINSRNNLISLGIPWHSFHFLTVADPIKQANWYISQIKDNPGPMPPVIDVELPSVPAPLLRTVVQRIYTVFQKWPLIYTSAYYWGFVVGDTDKQWVAERCPLWVAHYGTTSPILPTYYLSYQIHQYAANGDGLAWGAQAKEIDLDYSRKSWLAQFASTPTPIPVPTPIPTPKTINSRGYLINIRNEPKVATITDVGDARLVKAGVIEEITDWYKIAAWVAKNVTSEN